MESLTKLGTSVKYFNTDVLNPGTSKSKNFVRTSSTLAATRTITLTLAAGETTLAARPPSNLPKFTVVTPSNSSSSNSNALIFWIISINSKLASMPNSGYPEWPALPSTLTSKWYTPLCPTPRLNSVGSPKITWSHWASWKSGPEVTYSIPMPSTSSPTTNNSPSSPALTAPD
ncbi:hypothetical protein WICPIJ_009682 [Wickerhamomyces pijperi]|uniref:Uncharacterized protein n=1 Tax=Wickerhamomyces pijperi TaxID=599730 RepID=A0A9P8PKB5_WICPI|nr:hypothetical protein WICPIJ_009682 [Wickerhamomyces pijperi]